MEGPRERPATQPSQPNIPNRSNPAPTIEVEDDDEGPSRGKRVIAPSPSPSVMRRTKRPKQDSSKYFAEASGSTTAEERNLGRVLALSPHRQSPLFIRESEEPMHLEGDRGGRARYGSPDGSEDYWNVFSDVDQVPPPVDEPRTERGAVGEDYWDTFDINESELAATLVQTEQERLMSTSRRATSTTLDSDSDAIRRTTATSSSTRFVETIVISDSEEKEHIRCKWAALMH